MRRTVFCWIGLALMIAGCCSHESASSGDTSAESAETECKTGECCPSVSRSAVLTKSTANSDKTKANDESK